MKEIKWSLLKSERLKGTRGTFEEILEAELLRDKKHPTRKNQNIMLSEHKRYMWVVRIIREGDYIFLKTAFPSRRYARECKWRKARDAGYY